MKYVILIGDGMADYPMEELGGRTPLAAAKTPNMDFLATQGELGLARTIPEGMEPGSDVANLSIMGYDPAKYHTGRAPLEAASMGVSLEPQDVAFRCNLVTLRHEAGGDIFMEDYSAGHISSSEARELIVSINQTMGNGSRRFYPGVSYRHLLVWQGGQENWRTYPPHDLTGQSVRSYLAGEGKEKPLLELIKSSWPLLSNHSVNRLRARTGPEAGHVHLAVGARPGSPGADPAGIIWPYRSGHFRGGPDAGHRHLCRTQTNSGAGGHRLSGYQLCRQGGGGLGRPGNHGFCLSPCGGPG